MTTFRQLLDLFEESAKTRTAKGRVFERFCEAFFRTDPYWSEQFDEVWSWMDWPGREDRVDTGIDLVAQQAGTGLLVAIQCKFYSPDATLSWGHVSTFAGMLAQPEFAEGMIVSTAGAESSNVHSNLERHPKRIVFWRVDDFEESRVDWDQFRIDAPGRLALRQPKTLRPHQDKAITEVIAGFGTHERGQMVMACGTGKTFTSLRLAEQLVGPGGSVLFLVPSINLLSQSVLAWANDAKIPLATFAVCSDAKAGVRTDDEDMSVNDLAFPASTDAEGLVAQVQSRATAGHLTAIFATYQSIEVIAKAQASGLTDFDLIVCDEAHRTTGAFKEAGEQSAFTKIHDEYFVQGRRRLYMTATPRIYGDQSKAKAARADVIVASMDDETCFGPVFHELRFGDAVAQGLLTDYKVLVLAVNEDDVSLAFQREFADSGNELALDDVARIIGCWHGLSKRGPQFDGDNVPMRRAVAFSSTIVQSKRFAKAFPEIVDQALADRRSPNAVKVETDHVDGKTNVKVRSEAIAWLEEPPGQRVCRVLSNAKCLTEGVDVPALDAVLFLQPRKSVVEVVQAVGRVMRLNEGKEFGYVILPIGIPAGVAPEEALRDHKRYQVVWQVLQALRSHDERLAAEINKIDINGTSSKVNVIGIGLNGGADPADPDGVVTTSAGEQGQLDLPDVGELRDAIYARIVEKVGDRRYMDNWAADIQQIAAAQETRVRGLLAHPDQNPDAVERFDTFLKALQDNLNDSITADDAIGMLSQHLITRPVFEALFGGDEFTRQNPVSQVMQSMLDTLDDANLATETATLEGFYNHIRMLVGGIDTAEGRQRVITELYEKFFKKALPKAAESLGIVYTPIEIVDFINRAVDELLQEHFDGTSISDEGVHVLDPFTGTGTFIARLIQSGLIRPGDLQRKYTEELHANEIMLLAYYIAAINIETAYENTTAGTGGYEPFEGIVLTDTFQLSEESDPMDEVFFPRNNARADRQKALDIRVIVGNPPYSVGQRSQNDDNKNRKYPTLDASTESTYKLRSDALRKASLDDSYIRAFRQASNRIAGSSRGGIVGFVTNGGWIDGSAAQGIRRCFADEFHHIYVLNLRGNTRTSGEQALREGGQTFGPGSRSTIAITLLVKKRGAVPPSGAQIHYRDIGDYLTAEQKLSIVAESTVATINWTPVTPNDEADWVTLRDPRYNNLIPLSGTDDSIFKVTSNGLKTNRDAWVYNSSRNELVRNVEAMIDFYNGQLAAFRNQPRRSGKLSELADVAADFIDRDPRKYSWDQGDFNRMAAGTTYELRPEMIRNSLYRPFFPQHVAFDRTLNNSTYQLPRLFPSVAHRANSMIMVTNPWNTVPFSALGVAQIADLVSVGDKGGKGYARWRYEEVDQPSLLAGEGTGPTKVSNLNPAGVQRLRKALGDDISDDDIFAYVYGTLHSPDLLATFKVNLNKESPRIPLVTSRGDFDAFRSAGQELLDLHIGYDDVDLYPIVEEWTPGSDPATDPSVLLVGTSKMKYPEVKDLATGKKVKDKTRLIYNSYLTLSGIPLEAHDFVLGTRSGIDWIIDRWYVKTDKPSGIVNDVNQWGLERGEPRYIIDLVKRVVTVSMRTVEIVSKLPKLTF
jgi:predicted helicase